MMRALRKDLVEEESIIRMDLPGENGDMDQNTTVEKVYAFENMIIPNGLAVDDNGRLYVTDETFIAGGKIVRITLNDEAPVYEEWLTHGDEKKLMTSPNGIACRGNEIYYSNFQILNLKTQIIKVVMDMDTGSILSKTVFFERCGVTFFDDIDIATIAGSDCLITVDYLKGSVLIFDIQTGKRLYESSAQSFVTPTSAIIGREGSDLAGHVFITKMSENGLDDYPIPEF